jgi:hypothetical protein
MNEVSVARGQRVNRACTATPTDPPARAKPNA